MRAYSRVNGEGTALSLSRYQAQDMTISLHSIDFCFPEVPGARPFLRGGLCN
jgi:hypothetical protein